MEYNIDENLIRFSGRTPIEKELNIDDDIDFEGKGNVVKIETLNNQDGSVTLVYVVKPTSIEL